MTNQNVDPLMSAPPIQSDRYDAVAILASGLCLVHCMVLPVLLLLIPAWAAWLAVPEGYHLWMVGFAVPSSALALFLGRRRHDRWTPAAIAFPGLVALTAGALLFRGLAMETLLTVAGAISLTIDHILNGRYARAGTI